MKYYVLLVFILTAAFGTPPASARALRCEGIFAPPLNEYLTQFNIKFGSALFDGKNIDSFIQKYSASRQKKIRALLSPNEILNLSSTEAVERYSIELGILLFGSRHEVDRWIFKNKKQRLEESAVLLIKEEILLNGIEKYWQKNHDPLKKQTFAKFVDFIFYLHATKTGKLLQLPWNLPAVNERALSPELFYYIIRDGYQAHEPQVLIELQTQDRREAANTFRKLWVQVAFGLAIVLAADDKITEMLKERDDKYEETRSEIQKTESAIPEQISAYKQKLYRSVYESAREQFRKERGGEPTAAEDLELQIKIKKGLKIQD